MRSNVLAVAAVVFSCSNYADGHDALPLSFEPNQGQFPPATQFFARGSGYAVALSSQGAELRLPGAQLLSLHVEGARSADGNGEGRLPGVTNYFVGPPHQWRKGILNYSRVRFRSVYPGIDVVYYGNKRQLEYDFVVAPGANPKSIALSFDGAKRINIDASGDLLIDTGTSVIRQHRPVVYQTIAGKRRHVYGRYVRRESAEFGFEVGPYNRTFPLIIDPVLSYSTYTGGAGDDGANSVAVDSQGNTYIAGRTSSGSSDSNGFVQKINAAGTAVIYTSFLGQSCDDTITSVAVDGSGNAYVTGQVIFRDQYNLCNEGKVLLSKLGPTGLQVYGTSFGGVSGHDIGNDIAVDSQGNAYVTGAAESHDFPTTPGVFQPSSQYAAFVSKVNATGTAFIYSTYLGENLTVGYGIAVDASGNAHISGKTNSLNFPTTAGGYRRSLPNPAVSAFASKLNATGTALLYSTYLGGEIADEAFELGLDAQGNMYVVGTTQSSLFPTTPGAWDRVCGTDAACNPVYQCGPSGCRNEFLQDGFVAKINPFVSAGASLVYSTFLGGMSTDAVTSIAVALDGSAWLSGWTSSNNTSFPAVNAAQPQLAGGRDGFVAKLSPAGNSILFSTFLGGTENDVATGIAVDGQGSTHISGLTQSTNFFTRNPIYAANAGGMDAFVAKIGNSTSAPELSAIALNPTTLTAGGTSSGTVTLTSAAPAGGITVTLTSSNTNAATVPASVAVAAGAASATFTVTSKSVAAATAVMISSTLNTVTKTASLTINPASLALSSITLNPASVTGGKTSIATATLTAPAPVGGVVIALASSNTAVATTPTTVTIGAGLSTANFTVTAKAVTTSSVANISATYAAVTKTAALTVGPSALSTVGVSPVSVAGGVNALGNVVLTGVAPAGGVVVSLSSANPSVASPAASTVTVPAGAASATFQITTKSVVASTPVQISAAYGGTTKSVTLRVTPTALYSLSLAPSTVCGCKNTIGRVTLTGPAPAGGVTVSLSDTHSNAAVPPSVLVPAGATTAQFTITTTPVAAITNGLVTATYAGVTKSATLSVRPIGVAALALSPEVVLGPSPVTATVTLECAAGPSPITVSLSSTNPAVANPAVPAITIPVSSITGTFRVNTVDVSVSSSAIIRATANGLTGSRGMVVN